MPRAVSLIAAVLLSTACLITRTEEVRVPPSLTPPRIQDIQGLTSPRLGTLVVVDPDQATVNFRVPVEDDGVDDSLQWRFFVNDDRDCVPQEGGVNCDPINQPTPRELPGNGTRLREIRESVRVPRSGCNRIELYVSSRLRLSGNFRTPERPGDLAFTTWWVFVRQSVPGPPDESINDPVKRCPFRVQP